jgi:outer membrane protein OmpA-like peptidoglycan-associated protein
LEAISGKVSPQQVEETGGGETTDKTENALDKSVFEQMKISYPYIDGYQLKYSVENEDLKSIIVTIKPNYSITIEQVNSIINYFQELNDKIAIKVISDNILLQSILFEENSFEIEPSEQPKLDVLAAFLDYQDQYVLKATGYADSTGDQNMNEYISRMRAESVMNYLVKNENISHDRILVNYDSESDKEKELEEGRKNQRRVDLEIAPVGNFNAFDHNN